MQIKKIERLEYLNPNFEYGAVVYPFPGESADAAVKVVISEAQKTLPLGTVFEVREVQNYSLKGATWYVAPAERGMQEKPLMPLRSSKDAEIDMDEGCKILGRLKVV